MKRVAAYLVTLRMPVMQPSSLHGNQCVTELIYIEVMISAFSQLAIAQYVLTTPKKRADMVRVYVYRRTTRIAKHGYLSKTLYLIQIFLCGHDVT